MAELLTTVFNSIFPVFFIIILGFFLFKRNFLTVDIQKGLNKLAYWIGLPAFLFYKVANAKLEAETVGNIFTCVMVGTGVAMILGYCLAKVFKAPRASVGAAVQACGRGNQAFIALPVIIYTAEQLAPARADLLIDNVVLVLTPTVIIYNLICVTVLILHSSRESKNIKKDIVTGLLRNPLIISCVAGLTWNYLQIDMSKDAAMFRTCAALGQAAFPMALLGIGSQLAQIHLRGHIYWAFLFSAIKTIVAPLIGYGVSRYLEMDNIETLLAMIMLTTPTAVASYVLADQLECDPDLTASSIMLSVILSFFTFSALLIIFQ